MSKIIKFSEFVVAVRTECIAKGIVCGRCFYFAPAHQKNCPNQVTVEVKREQKS